MESNIKYKFNPAALILILLGIIAVAFPLASTMTVGVITGFSFIMIALFLIISGANTFSYNKGLSILSIILAILSIILGWMIIFNPFAMSAYASFITYLAGFIMIFNGISLLAAGSNFRHLLYMGILNIIMGILFIILAFYVLNPLYLGLVIGIWLIMAGILELFKPEYEEYIDV